jgi:hypothetical protein
MLEIGDWIVFYGCIDGYTMMDVTIGRIYTLDGMDRDGDFFFIDDVGELNFAADDRGKGVGKFIKIVD